MFNKILVAVEDSEMGKYVFAEALALAKATDARLMLLSVLCSEDVPYLNYLPGTLYQPFNDEVINLYIQREEELKKEGINFLQSLSQKAIAENVTVEFTQAQGEPSRTICQLAKSWEADLIVMGRRGLSGISEFLIGSVSNYVLHHAKCSVLALQGKMFTSSD
ncbi:MAG: universal stress protein [Nostocaceae cyanobacterium]|nr:universal stress protein [Nostocaceae cyanobacterium]